MRIAVLAAPIFVVLAVALAACGQKGASTGASGTGGGAAAVGAGSTKGVLTPTEFVMGNPDAKVTVTEYLSDTCSHCAAFDAEVWPKVKAKYVDTGKVKWAIREFLTEPTQVSAAGFVLARCAGPDKYFSVIESIFHSQEEMFKTGDFKTPFQRIATSMGMNESQFNACISDDKAYAALYDRVQKASTVDKVDGTPTFFINGKKAFEAEASLADFDKAFAAAGVT